LHALAPAQIAPIVHAYAESPDKVFLWSVPVAILGFLLALTLKAVPLRGSARASAADLGDGFGMPTQASSERCLERAMIRREDGVLTLTAAGETEISRLTGALRAWLRQQLADWEQEADEEQIGRALDRIARRMLGGEAIRSGHSSPPDRSAERWRASQKAPASARRRRAQVRDAREAVRHRLDVQECTAISGHVASYEAHVRVFTPAYRRGTPMERRMNPERSHAYRYVIQILGDLGPDELSLGERERIRIAADNLVLSKDQTDELIARDALDDSARLLRAVVASGRWEQLAAKRLADALRQCGPPHVDELKAA